MRCQLRLDVNFNFRMAVLAGVLLANVAGLLPALPADAADRLVIYSGRKEKAIKPVVDEFTKQTGIQVDLKVGKTSGLANEIRMEKARPRDRKSTRLNSSHLVISYAVFCLKKKKE